MPGNTVSFMQPGAILAPDLSVEQAKLQRQYELAQALRQMSLEQVDGGRGPVSWTQGAAKIAQALAGRNLVRRADDKQLAVNQAYASRLGSMFGGHPKGGDPTSTPSQASDPSAPLSNIPHPIQSVDPDAAASTSSPAPSAPPAAQAGNQPGYTRGPLSLTDNPTADMLEFTQQPEKYWDARNQQNQARLEQQLKDNAPVELARTVQQARAAMDRGDMATAHTLLASIQKSNFIEPSKLSPGDLLHSNMGEPDIIAPDTKTGLQFSQGQNGWSASPIPGVQAQLASNAGAVKAAEQRNTILPGQVVNGNENVPVWGGDVPHMGGPPSSPANIVGAVQSVLPGAVITSGLRTPAEQAALIRSGATSATNSAHVSGNAFDMRPVPGMSAQQALQKLQAAGVPVTQVIDEQTQGTGPHWHFAGNFGGQVPTTDTRSNSFGKNPAQQAYETGNATNMVAYKNDLNTRVRQGFELTQRLNEQQHLVQQFRTGATADVRAHAAAFARDIGAPEGIVRGLAGGDPTAAQAFNKFAAQTALEQLRQSVGNNRILKTEYDAFAKANPNLTTDPAAIAKIAAFQRNLYNRDYAEQQGLQQYEHSGQNISNFPSWWESQRHNAASSPSPAGTGQMRQVGTYRGRPVLQDAHGKRWVQ